MTIKSAPGASSARKYNFIALLVAGAAFMELLDGTVIATALPQMARSFAVSPVDLNVGMTAYLLTLGVFIPVSGWIADRFGSRSVFGTAILIFTVASVLCGFSQGMWSFTAARVLQGIGGAMMVPVGRLVVLKTTAKKDLIRAIALIVWPGLVAPMLGPPLGGFLTTYFTWRWIFFLNLPIGVAGLILNFVLIPKLRAGSKRPLDFVGFVLSGAAFIFLVYGLDLVGKSQGSGWLPAGLIAAGLVSGWLGLWHFRSHPTPLLEFGALRLATFSIATWGGSLFRLAINAVPFLLPLMFQLAFGLDAFKSGLLVLCVFAGNLGIKPATTPLLRRFGFRTMLLANGFLTAILIAACGFLSPATPVALIALVLFLGGAGRSVQFTSFATIQFADVPEAELSGANTLSSMIFQLAVGVGIAFGALELNASAWLRGLPGGNPDLHDFHAAFFVLGVLTLLATLDALRLDPHAGHVISGHRRRKSPRTK